MHATVSPVSSLPVQVNRSFSLLEECHTTDVKWNPLCYCCINPCFIRQDEFTKHRRLKKKPGQRDFCHRLKIKPAFFLYTLARLVFISSCYTKYYRENLENILNIHKGYVSYETLWSWCTNQISVSCNDS